MERIDERPTLRAWLAEYAEIEQEYLDGIAAAGIALAPRGADEAEVAAVRERLRGRGVRFRNAGASVSAGALSSACVACTGGPGSKTFFLSLACNRRCYFCFNANQADYEQARSLNAAWRDEVDAFFAACDEVTHVGLTGGEPLLHPREAVEFVAYVHRRAPKAHIRIYTAGDFLDEALLAQLRDAGLAELRLSVKVDVGDDPEGVIAEAGERIALAARFIPEAMVEMPVIPGTGEAMRSLLRRIDAAGAFGINLLEFCYPMGAWDEFAARGFQVRNPPFDVLYDWGYAGGLPIAGSERLSLELLEFAVDEGLSLGVHYCSLANKHRDQVVQQNRAAAPDARVYAMDDGDFFYKTVKLFDGDAPVARAALVRAGCDAWALDREEGTLLVHPGSAGLLDGLPVLPAVSYSIVEGGPEAPRLRELALRV